MDSIDSYLDNIDITICADDPDSCGVPATQSPIK